MTASLFCSLIQQHAFGNMLYNFHVDFVNIIGMDVSAWIFVIKMNTSLASCLMMMIYQIFAVV